MQIQNFKIGGDRVFIIAEIGNNHNGSYETAIKMVDLAISIGVDCVKFQMRNLQSVYRKKSLEKKGDDLGTEYIVDLLNKFELSTEAHKRISEYCRRNGILYLCTPWDHKSLAFLESINVPAYKVASADLTNLPLIDAMCNTGKPLILSTGMSTASEVENTVNFLNSKNASFALLHCNSTYPAPYADINLRWMNQLKKMHPLVGYSGHERGVAVSYAAVALGASIIERHITLDRNMEGPDHAASLEILEFGDMVEGIRQIEQSLGDGLIRNVSQGEMINRENLSKSLVSSKKIKKGTILSGDDIKVCSPGQGLSPQFYSQLIGTKILRDMEDEDYFFATDIDGGAANPRPYKFKRPWGVPVRFYDFGEYSNKVKPDLFEFHFSYSDMDLNPGSYIASGQSMDFVVHAPELFKDSHLLDLATHDTKYRSQSIIELQRVIDITREMKKFFSKTARPIIVTNIGGFSMDSVIPKNKIEDCYLRFADSLSRLDLEGVELCPQTMAPFPWHFGGQRYQNLFIESDEIIRWCKNLNLRMCFDISHSALASNFLGVDFYDFAEKIAPYTAHLHIGDAKGVNGEGLQIESGEIDFRRLNKIFYDGCPNASFIPEIWQGHKNGGQGFWLALERLEELWSD